MINTTDIDLAILMTCHNRCRTTIKCLNKLENQEGIEDVNITIFLVDDGSTDGTAEEVKKTYPNVNILPGSGNLFWSGGMRKAMNVAVSKKFDFYLWLNDDTRLYTNAISKLLNVYYEKKSGIVVGSLCDPSTKKWTYGASIKNSFWNPLKFRPIFSPNKILSADNFWGNVVLIPHEIANVVGNIDKNLIHGAGDHDYALRTKKAGFDIWLSPGYIGECSRNPLQGTWKDSTLSFKERVKKIFSIKGRPIRPRLYYLRKHGGFFFFLLFFSPYIQLIIDHILVSWFGMNSIFQKNPLKDVYNSNISE